MTQFIFILLLWMWKAMKIAEASKHSRDEFIRGWRGINALCDTKGSTCQTSQTTLGCIKSWTIKQKRGWCFIAHCILLPRALLQIFKQFLFHITRQVCAKTKLIFLYKPIEKNPEIGNGTFLLQDDINCWLIYWHDSSSRDTWHDSSHKVLSVQPICE